MLNAKSSLLKPLLLALVLGSFVTLRANTAEGTEFDVRPTPVKTPPPEYPSKLKQGGVSGVVALKVEIDENGAVTACSVSKSSNPEFEQPAMDAVKNWKFKPAQKGGNPVKVRLLIPIQFRIDD
jgi:protein TonB